MDIIGTLVGILGDIGNWIKGALVSILNFLEGLLNHLGGIFNAIGGFFTKTWAHMVKIWNAIKNLATTQIWSALQTLHNWIQRAIAWVNKYILGPIKAEEAELRRIYNMIFAPVLKAIDSVRKMLDTIFFWDKALRQKLDSFFYQVESDLLKPINTLWNRLNVLSSTITGILTLVGRFDGQIFVETLIYHFWDIWGGLSSLGVSFSGSPTVEVPFSIVTAASDYEQYLRDGTGNLADRVNHMDNVYLTTLAQLGVTLG